MKTFVSCARLAALPLALAAAFPSFAQTQLKDVVVTASRVEQRIQDALPATTLITRADIERAQTPDLLGLLKNVTGLELTQNGGAGTVAAAFIRGAESRHTLVLIDGVPVNNLNFGLSALEHLPLSNVERIEIVRGNVSALYGSSALGGVIRIFTRDASEKPFGALTAQIGSRGLAMIQASAGFRTATGTGLSFTAEHLSDDGFNAIDQSKRVGTNPDTDGYQRRSVSLALSQEIGGGRVGFTVRKSDGSTAYDSQFGPANQADESKFAVQSMALSGRFSLSSAAVLDLGVSSTEDRLRADVTAFPYFVNSIGQQANAGLTWQFRAGQTVTTGLESTRQRIESDTIYTASSRTIESARLGYQGESERHQVQINVRRDQYSDFGGASTWFAGYAFRLSDAWRVNGSISTGFTAPTFNDLYYPFGGNASLRPERLRTRELGLQYAVGVSELSAVLFHNQFVDLIGNDASFNRININQARNEGLELSYRGRYGATTVGAGLTLQDPVDLISNARLNRRAAVLANLSATHEVGSWSYGAKLRYSGERSDGAKTLENYSVLDLTISHSMPQGVKIFGRIDNLLDSRYETVYGYNQARRGVFVGLSWQPKS